MTSPTPLGSAQSPNPAGGSLEAATSYTIGSVRVHLFSDGLTWADGGGMFGLVPRVLWEKVVQPDAFHRVPMAQRCMVVESSNELILVDTGYGDKLTAKQRQQLDLREENRLLRSLATLGFRPEDVSLVINTHLHSDHCGGNTRFDPDGRVVPTFPHATYLMQRLELADATYPNERTRATYLCENFLPLVSLCDGAPSLWDGGSARREGEIEDMALSAGATARTPALPPEGDLRHARASVLSGDTQITPEVRVMVTPGHTRAHQVVIVESQGEVAVFLGDVASYAINIERLAWVPAYDVEPLVSIETKRNLRDWAWRKGALLFFQHDVKTPAGRVRPDGDGWRVEAV